MTTSKAAVGYRAVDFMPGIAVDAVIFGFHDKQLKVLLLEYRNTKLFALPGGFVGAKEDLDEAALRVVRERTGLEKIFLQQFHSFGSYARFDSGPMKAIMLANSGKVDKDHWLLQRFISIAYYALVDFTEAIPTPDAISDSCGWYDLKKMPKLIQDHAEIVASALENLRESLDRRLTGFKLLPAEFTMPEIQSVYETILDKKLHRPVFQRKMLGLGILKRLAKKKTGKAHKAPYIYRFKVKGKRLRPPKL